MTNAQRLILKAGLVVAAVAGLFPPWEVDMAAAGNGASGIIGRGHHFILANYYAWRIDVRGLLVIWAVIAIVTGALYMFAGANPGPQK